jgi:hypothetical protein
MARAGPRAFGQLQPSQRRLPRTDCLALDAGGDRSNYDFLILASGCLPPAEIGAARHGLHHPCSVEDPQFANVGTHKGTYSDTPSRATS